MLKSEEPYTNVTLQTFASEGDSALVDSRWELHGAAFLERLGRAGLLSYEKANIWNKDSKLMRFIIFRYKNPESMRRCAPIWEEVEKEIFKNAVIKVTAYRGISVEYWEPD